MNTRNRLEILSILWGLEPFVLKELAEKFKTLVITVNDKENFKGKILFSIDNPVSAFDTTQVSRLLLDKLKTVERLFGFVYADCNVDSILYHPNEKLNVCLQALYGLVVKITPSISEYLEELAKVQMAITESQHDGGQEVEDGDFKDVPSKRPRESVIYSFRVDVKITGKYRSLLNTYQSTRSIGAALLKNLLCPKDGGSWKVDLNNPQMTINVYVTDDGFLCGVPLIQHSIQTNRSHARPLSERNYLNTTPMRSTVAYILASLVVMDETDKEKSLSILDPTSGSCLILIELVKNFPQVLLAYGVDNSRDQLEHADKNIEKAKVGKNVLTILGDSTQTIFREDIIFDGVVCDLPFGEQHGTHNSVVRTLPLIFNNIDKVVKMKGNIVLLISLALSTVMEDIIVQNDFTWTLVRKDPVKLGVLQAVIYHYKKSSCSSDDDKV